MEKIYPLNVHRVIRLTWLPCTHPASAIKFNCAGNLNRAAFIAAPWTSFNLGIKNSRKQALTSERNASCLWNVLSIESLHSRRLCLALRSRLNKRLLCRLSIERKLFRRFSGLNIPSLLQEAPKQDSWRRLVTLFLLLLLLFFCVVWLSKMNKCVLDLL